MAETLPGAAPGGGASRSAIAKHYDLGNAFFAVWLDDGMTYSAGLWDGVDGLDAAQRQKLDFHIDWARARGANHVLDVGCGWGSLLERLVREAGARTAVGLTLSAEQASYIQRRNLPGVEIRLESWVDHSTSIPYDAIISIGAFEHFVSPETPPEERVSIYRRFFSSCRSWLKPNGMMSLQTIAYARGRFTGGSIASIFPESDLPRLDQIVSALDGQFEILELRNDRSDYARTCQSWLTRLSGRRHEAIALVGERTVRHYEAFLAASARGFEAGVFSLLRIRLRRED